MHIMDSQTHQKNNNFKLLRNFTMYKKFMLTFMFVSCFAHNQLFCSSDNQNTALNNFLSGVALLTIGNASSIIYNWAFPSSTAQVAAKYAKAKFDFQDCLIKTKMGSKKNEIGVPLDCEEIARAFIVCGGHDEII